MLGETDKRNLYYLKTECNGASEFAELHPSLTFNMLNVYCNCINIFGTICQMEFETGY